MTSVHVLYDGYSYLEGENMFANCTCSLILGEKNIVVDCMSPWDADKLLKALALHSLNPSQIDYVICTHGHSDHIGNLNLFLNAIHIVGFTISKGNKFFNHPFDRGESYIINRDIKVVPTPGHTVEDVSVYVTAKSEESSSASTLYVIAGDLFEREDDIHDSSLWKEQSFDPKTQLKYRQLVAAEADIIIPGHGPMFTVTDALRQCLLSQTGDAPLSAFEG